MERTVVHIVVTARVTDCDSGSPSHAVSFVTVTATGGHTGHVCTVGVIVTHDEIAAHFELFAFFIRTEAVVGLTGLTEIGEGIAGTVFAVGSGSRHREDTTAL